MGSMKLTPEKLTAFCAALAETCNVGGQIMTARKAMYMAAFPQRKILDKRRISSKCENQHCINPDLLVQVTASGLLKSQYVKGLRCRVSKHLVAQQRKNTRISDETVLRIMADERRGAAGHKDYGISKEHYNAIQRGAARVKSNPFAALIGGR